MSYHITPQGNAAECKARQGRCPFGAEADHYATKADALKAYESSNDSKTLPEKPVSTSMLQNSSFEAGYAARAYFRLLNHQNYDHAKNLYGKVKDQEVIDAVKEKHRAETALLDLELQLTKAQKRVETAQTEAQHDGYVRAADQVTMRFQQTVADFDTASENVDKLKAKYAKNLAIHNNSLKSLERLANSEKPISRPEGIENRIRTLKETQKNTKSIKTIAAQLGRGQDLDRVVKAAEAYGNPHYTENAVKLRDASLEKAAAEVEKAKLLESTTHSNKAIREAAQAEVAKIDYSMVAINSRINAATPRVALFKDEVRDRGLYENDITRELNALVTIEARTRN